MKEKSLEEIDYDAIKGLSPQDVNKVLATKINEIARAINEGVLWDRKVLSDRRTDDTENGLADIDRLRSKQNAGTETALIELAEMITGGNTNG